MPSRRVNTPGRAKGDSPNGQSSAARTPAANSGPLGSQLFEQLYGELRIIASAKLRRERPNHTLQTTALVHEAYVRLAAGQYSHDRIEFLQAASRAMRHVLVDYARRRGRQKRGRGWKHVTLGNEPADSVTLPMADILTLHDALSDLEDRSPRCAKVVELRFFGGLTVRETADVLGASKSSVDEDWQYALAWLQREITRQAS